MIETKNLNVYLSGRQVLENVNLRVEAGDLAVLLGPNGAGKTTLLRSILGLQKSTGQVVCERHSIGYVPQRHNIQWDFPITVFDTVLTAFTGKNKLWKSPTLAQMRQAQAALTQTGMAQFAKRPLAELSGGQKQRVLVARALAAGTKFLLLDEPFTGMDILAADSVFMLLKDLSSKGYGVLLSTHDLPSALSHCTKAHLLNKRLIASGVQQQLHNSQVWEETFGVTFTHPTLAAVKEIISA